MRKLTVTTFVSLDGVMQAPGGPSEDRSGDFALGGWLVPHFDDDLGAFMCDVFAKPSAFLLGRTTYEIFAAHWPRVPMAGDPIATALNTLPKLVASTTLRTVSWQGARLLEGDTVRAIAQLKESGEGGELQVHGSAGLLQTLIAHDLVDTYRIITFPVVLGRGKRLFGAGAVPRALRRVDGKTTAKGVVIGTYERAGALERGSFALDD